MDEKWTYQKNDIKNEELDVARSSHDEPQAKKAKKSLGAAGFIQDECEVNDHGESDENEEDCTIDCTADDIDFIDDLLSDENSWEQYLNL